MLKFSAAIFLFGALSLPPLATAKSIPAESVSVNRGAVSSTTSNCAKLRLDPSKAVRRAHNGLVNFAIRISSIGIEQPGSPLETEAAVCRPAEGNFRQNGRPAVETARLP